MPVLEDPRREKFAQLVAAGKTLGDAYGEAGYKDIDRKAAHRNGLAVRRRPEVTNRIKEILEVRSRAVDKAFTKSVEAVAKVGLTKEFIIESLMKNVRMSLQMEPILDKDGEKKIYRYDGSVANRSLELLGKELSMFVDRKEVGAPGEFAELDADGLRKAIVERITLVRESDGSFGVPGEEGSLREESD